MINELLEKKHLSIPEPSLRRLPSYLNYLKQAKNLGRDYISAPIIANDLNLDPTQVTKDLAYTAITGKTKIGYCISDLIRVLENFLGYHRADYAFLVGVGNLGSALLRYEGFNQTGFNIVAAFDNNPKIIGKKHFNIEVFHVDKFRDLATRLHVQIGIITTPPSVAQHTADLMAAWGIRAIWNFTQVPIRVPTNIAVENTSLYSNLAVLINKLQKLG